MSAECWDRQLIAAAVMLAAALAFIVVVAGGLWLAYFAKPPEPIPKDNREALAVVSYFMLVPACIFFLFSGGCVVGCHPDPAHQKSTK